MTASIILGERTVATLDLNDMGDLSRAVRIVIGMKDPTVSPEYCTDHFVVTDKSGSVRLWVHGEEQ